MELIISCVNLEARCQYRAYFRFCTELCSVGQDSNVFLKKERKEKKSVNTASNAVNKLRYKNW